ncbi:MAG: M3 family metallopeptidase [Sutterellaceae bacterium]|nr:M3 family metallopeptidase [Burkholderiaceae bacterium]MDW8430471.1 M3 family metallopeptidase [Sutterellaceae bacterium]
MPFDRNPNPLLDFSGLARFDAIRPAHITPAIETLLADCRAAVARVTDPRTPATWEAVVEPLDDAIDRLSRAWSSVAHLNAVVDTPELRAAYNANLPKVTAFYTELAQNEALYVKYKALAASPEFTAWSAARRKVIENELRDFRLGGAELPPAQKVRLKEVRERAAQLSTRFAENVLDATQAFALYIEERTQLDGIPEDVLQQYRDAAAADGRSGYKLTLQYPSYIPAMQYAANRTLRARLHRAYHTRASDLGDPQWDNTAVILELLRLRREAAHLLGFANYAELSLATKMADSPATVLAFLRDLAQRARPYAERDIAELRDFAAAELGIRDLQAWDIAYASEKLREARYAYSEQELKSYFPEPQVLAGLFKVIETLFSVTIQPDRGPVWHPDVRLYRIETRGGQLLGQFYLDLYARDHKQGGAWQDDARARRRIREMVQTPVSFLTCNFSRPVGDKPALLTHDEVLTLFHEFGHGLHHLLTQVDELGVSGLHGVEWDAVELPSQFFENFAWEWEVLQFLTAHVEDGRPLPRALYDRMIAARNFQSGFQMMRQIEFGLFDMRLHTDFDPTQATEADLQRLADEVRREVSVAPTPDYVRSAHSFTHIFSGGYAAGYYSYKWAEVLSADCYAAFEESGQVLDARIGARFRDEILAVGGSRPAIDSFIAFRGRAPRIDALLRHHGMAA